MTVRMMAPYGAPMMMTLIKNPELSNTEAADVKVNHRKSMNGIRYSYVNTSDKIQLTWTWNRVDRGKLIEVEEFVRAFTGEEIQLVDWNEDVWRARLLTTPVDFEIDARNSPCPPGKSEAGSFTLQFLAHRLTPNVYGDCDADGILHEIAFNQLAVGVLPLKVNVINGIGFDQVAEGEIGIEALPLFLFVDDVNILIQEVDFLGAPIFIEQDAIVDPDFGA